MQTMQPTGIHIRVADILHVIIKRRLMILTMTIGGLIIGLGLSGMAALRGEMRREYSVEAALVLTTQNEQGKYASGQDYPNHNDINMATAMIDTARYVLRSDALLSRVLDRTRLIGITEKDIQENLTLTQQEGTQVIKMALYWRTAEEGIAILNAICAEAPGILQEKLGVGGVAFVNQPKAKHLAGRHSSILLWGLTTVLGCFIGIGITLMELIMHPTVRRAEDVEPTFGIGVLAEVLSDVTFFRKRDSILTKDGQFSRTKESFASAAYAIKTFFKKRTNTHILCVTSTLRGEGKTAITANLAISLAEQGKRVLLIDFDMSKPELANLFLHKPEVSQSLNALYNGESTPAESVISLTANLYLLPTLATGSAISLDEDTFAIIRTLAADYDYVLIDTQPIGLYADVMRMEQLCSAAVFVIQCDMASLQEIRDALDRLEKSKLRIMGAIVNGVRVSKREIRTPMREREAIRRAVEREKDVGEVVVRAPVEQDGERWGDKSRSDMLVSWFGPQGDGEEAAQGGEDDGISTEASLVQRLLDDKGNAAPNGWQGADRPADHDDGDA